MDIIRGFEEQLIDQSRLDAERLVVRSLARGLITQAGADELLKEIWHD